MLIGIASQKDAKDISQNNIKMAKETENLNLTSHVALQAVMNLINNPSKGFYLVAKKNNEIIGQLMITYEWSDWRNKTIWWIQSVFVNPFFRNQGVFVELYNHIIQLAKNQDIELLRLYVHNQNDTAISVYESIGMKQKPYTIYESNLNKT
jgi:ribosomal protein S18 acetylase RimI-like enzyme